MPARRQAGCFLWHKCSFALFAGDSDTVGSTYNKYSNSLGVYGNMTEKTLRENASNFAFVQGCSNRAQIVLTNSDGPITIRFSTGGEATNKGANMVDVCVS